MTSVFLCLTYFTQYDKKYGMKRGEEEPFISEKPDILRQPGDQAPTVIGYVDSMHPEYDEENDTLPLWSSSFPTRKP